MKFRFLKRLDKNQKPNSRIASSVNSLSNEEKLTIDRKFFIDHLAIMQLQNLSGKETLEEAFKLGVGCAFDELSNDIAFKK